MGFARKGPWECSQALTLMHFLTSYANWIWRAKGNKGWLNSPVIIQNDSPATYGSAVSCTVSL